MKVLFAFLFIGSVAQARDITKSECVGPAGAPVKAIYMHGLFNDDKSAWYTPLEEGNRKKLEELAKKMNIRIAIPTAPKSNGGMYRWEGQPLSAVERAAQSGCGGAHLDVPRALIGFSSGGYAARAAALTCDSKLKSSYAAIIMVGAHPAPPVNTSYADCPKFTFMAGTSDGVNNKFKADLMLNSYKSKGGGDTDFVTYPGGHTMPPNDLLEKQLQSVFGKTSTAPASTGTPTGTR